MLSKVTSFFIMGAREMSYSHLLSLGGLRWLNWFHHGLRLLEFLSFLGLSLEIVLSEIAVLAHAGRIVRLVRMTASVGHLGLASSVVAVLAHILGVVLSFSVRTLVDRSSGPLCTWKLDLDHVVLVFYYMSLFDTCCLLRLSLLNVEKVVQIVR